MEIVQCEQGLFTARAVAADGFPPLLYRYKGWRLFYAYKKKFDLGEAPRPRPRRVPGAADEHCRREMVLPVLPHQRRRRFATQADGPQHVLRSDAPAALGADARAWRWGLEAGQQSGGSSRHGDAYLWFRAPATGQRLGLCTSVWERMRWEDEDSEKVAGGGRGSVLVERFAFKRMDGSWLSLLTSCISTKSGEISRPILPSASGRIAQALKLKFWRLKS
jgi:hypothetical protein